MGCPANANRFFAQQDEDMHAFDRLVEQGAIRKATFLWSSFNLGWFLGVWVGGGIAWLLIGGAG